MYFMLVFEQPEPPPSALCKVWVQGEGVLLSSGSSLLFSTAQDGPACKGLLQSPVSETYWNTDICEVNDTGHETLQVAMY